MIHLHYADGSVNGEVRYTVTARDDAGGGGGGAELHAARVDLADAGDRAAFARAVAEAAGAPDGAADVEAELARKLAEAELRPRPVSVRRLVAAHPHLRPPLVEGVLRLGEVANVIAGPKTNKSWLVGDLSLSVATGRPWLGRFPTRRGRVLVLDNELHPETLAKRIPAVMAARGIGYDELGDDLHVDSLRGRLRDIVSMASYFAALEPGAYALVVLDALYRFMPSGPGAGGENDNAAMAEVYNALDRYAARLGCAFVCVHHTSKGVQGGKAVTDVGAGAGAQSRAADAHLVLRPHEEDDAVVLEAVVRSWPPVAPLCLRWTFPVWNPDDMLDPTQLRRENRGRQTRAERAPAVPPEPKVEWTAESFTSAFITSEPKPKEVVVAQAKQAKLSGRQAEELLALAEYGNLIHRWPVKGEKTIRYASRPPELFEPRRPDTHTRAPPRTPQEGGIPLPGAGRRARVRKKPLKKKEGDSNG